MMKADNHTNHCREICKNQAGFWSGLRWSVLERLNDHVAYCPRCQRRLAIVNRVEIAMMLLKTQSQDIDLLARANSKALDAMKHSLRNAPQSAMLRTTQVGQNRFEKNHPGLERALNFAACVFVLVMIKTGVSNSLLDYKRQGEDVILNYYARNLDSQMLDEIFPSDSSPTEQKG